MNKVIAMKRDTADLKGLSVEATKPWWLWFVICWGALIVLWLCFGKK